MRCPVCATLNDHSSRFCENCGESLQTSATLDVASSSDESILSASDGIFTFSSKKNTATEKATRMNRLLAQLIDGAVSLICLIPLIPMMFSLIITQSHDNPLDSPIELLFGIGLSVILLIILGGYQLYILTMSGQTIGKRMMKIKIIKSDTGENPGFVIAVLLRSLVPSLINSVVGIFSIVDYCFIFREDRRCIHDLLASTDVIDC